MTDIYPGVDDWDRQALDLLPGVARAGAGSSLGLAMVAPLAVTELVVESVARELADIEVAGLYIARQVAKRYNVKTAGLDVREVRRLAAGGAAALACDGTDSRLYAMWTALTGSTTVTVRTQRSTTTPSYQVYLTGAVSWQPSKQWLREAARIVSRCVDGGAEVEAVVYLTGYLEFDELPGLDGAPMSYGLPI